MEPVVESYEDQLLSTLDTEDHDAVLDVLLRAVLIIYLESSENEYETNFSPFCHRMENAVNAMEHGKSLRTVHQLLLNPVDCLSEDGTQLRRLNEFVEKLERNIKTAKRGKR